MVVPVINYQNLTPQGNPAAKGMLPSLMQGLQLGMMPHQMKQQLEQQRLANALKQLELQYAPQMNDAELAYKQAQTPHMNAQTRQLGLESQYYPQDITSRIDERNVGTQLNKEQLRLLPLDYLLKFNNNNKTSTRFGDAYQLSRMLGTMPSSARAVWISENQEAYNDMLNTLANKTLAAQENKSNDVLKDALSKYFPNEFKDLTINPNEEETQNLINAGIGKPDLQNLGPLSAQLNNIQQSQLPQNNSFSSNPEMIDRMRTASQISANNSLTTAASRRQLEGAIQVGEIMNDPGFQSRAINASRYAGAVGKGKASMAALSQKNPQAYEDYLTFLNTDVVLLQNRIKTLDQMGATDAQREELHGLYSRTMDNITSNPEQFLIQLNNLGKAVDNVARGVEKSTNPLGFNSRIKEYSPINLNNATGGMAVVQSPNGKKFQVPASNLQELLTNHPDFKRVK